ncbi:hypothetical protein [Leucobacter massiliensis]|uniref:Uncharacterized protein n=1 Tax=Leucobacter massiliensis TaxID=1686285 RepID=A0A2S9QQQ8_9MICO|nr:hypothetical protein [Leucobacter massiliensis]PRI11917.1 hypothetical protein B4915_02235 [Leucobacter massiliensis]
MELVIGAVLAATGVTAYALSRRALRLANARMKATRGLLEQAAEALAASAGLSVRAVPVDSPEGRALLDRLRLSCECRDCEEERRIAHAEQQRGEK